MKLKTVRIGIAEIKMTIDVDNIHVSHSRDFIYFVELSYTIFYLNFMFKNLQLQEMRSNYKQ